MSLCVYINFMQVSKAHFKVLLRYLEGLQGHQRQLVTERARIILDQYSEEMPEGNSMLSAL